MLAALLRIALPLYAVCTLGRIALWIWQHDRLSDLGLGAQLMAFAHGLRMDTIAIGWLLAPAVLMLCFTPPAAARGMARALRGWALAALLLLVFVEVATFPFFAEYDARPNFLFTAYLEYPVELAALVWEEQKLGLAVTGALFGAVLWLRGRRAPLEGLEELLGARWFLRAALSLPLALLLLGGIRSSLGHRPANTSDAIYCENRVAGEIAKNSLHSAAYEAWRGRRDGQRLARQYGALPTSEAYARVDALLGTASSPERPFRRLQPSARPAAHPRSLVLIIEESMGARFVGHLGDTRALTPRIDELAQSSLTFSELYSNGTRSIRGLSGLSAGFLPIPGDGVLKRPKSQSGFFTLSSLLEPHGYHTSFIYGGEARFDNMRSWYLGNGFDLVIEEKDYADPSFRATWGVCDEDLLMKADELFVRLHGEGRPFASVVFTSSNHSPFELPEGKVEWVAGVPRQSVENAIRYADYAVGRYFEVARTRPYYADTVFVVVADHDVRVYGDSVVPVDAFHIPGLIHGVGIEPRVHTGIASQPDLLATALSQLGLDLELPILGTPISQAGRKEFVLMQFNEAYGFRRGDKVAVLRPNLAPETFLYRGQQLVPTEEDAELERDGLALVHVAEDLYDRRLYR